ncbi:MAG: OadG family protein [bacterium]|nr:OadG family protein [bacterium]
MTVLESLPLAAFCLSVVFFVLICLCLFIKILSLVVRLFLKSEKSQAPSNEADSLVENTLSDTSRDQLKLYNVDEQTAAMLMAIVSDECGVPVEELVFKSIKAVD